MSAANTAVVIGMDWDGNPVERVLRPGWQVALRGKLGQGFDTRGPSAWMCKECGQVIQSDGPVYLVTQQDHYYTTHGYTPALLP